MSVRNINILWKLWLLLLQGGSAMLYKQRRRLYSQNFLRSPELVKKLLRKSSIGLSDLVLEIGPGRGVITNELLNVSDKIIAVEKDQNLFNNLRSKFGANKKLFLVNTDYLNYKSPSRSYKVFANIPFGISADIVRKLTNDSNFQEGYLIVQKEFAQKIIGTPYDYKNQMMSVLLKPWFDISVFHKLSRTDFYPIPNVDIVMIHVKRLHQPLVQDKHKKLYVSFIVSAYNKTRLSRQKFDRVLTMFNNFFRQSNPARQNQVISQAQEILKKQKGIQKIRRTRRSNNWRRFKLFTEK